LCELFTPSPQSSPPRGEKGGGAVLLRFIYTFWERTQNKIRGAEMADQMMHATQATNLADILERVLDKGIVIAGDIKIQLADIDLLNIKIRLLLCSVDKAMEMGINWWQQDSYLSTKAREKEIEQENTKLRKRLERLEAKVK